MATKINFADCNQDRFGTGVLDCEIQPGVPTGFILTRKAWRFNPETETFDNEYIEDQIKEGNMIPFLNALSFEPENEEAEIFTSNLKVQQKVMDGLPGFLFTFSRGRAFHRAAFSYNSFGNYDVIIVYNNGVIDAALTADGQVKGYTAGMINTDQFRQANGTDPQGTDIRFQLLDSYEYNTMYALISAAENGFSLSTIAGVIDVDIFKVSNATTDVVVEVVAAANRAVSIAGLTADDFLVTGTTETIDSVVYDAAAKQYTITFTGDVSSDYNNLKLELYDTSDNTYVIKKGVTLYKGGTR